MGSAMQPKTNAVTQIRSKGFSISTSSRLARPARSVADRGRADSVAGPRLDSPRTGLYRPPRANRIFAPHRLTRRSPAYLLDGRPTRS
jgi:hypothetical protein